MTSATGSARKQRVEHAIREVLGHLVRDEVRDPRVRAATLLTITKVELNVDLSVANVYVSIAGDDDATADGVITGLKKAAGFLRGPVGREVGMQHAPELRFHRDLGIDMSEKLASIIREDEARARAAGRASAGSSTAPTPSTPPAKPAPIVVQTADDVVETAARVVGEGNVTVEEAEPARDLPTDGEDGI